MASEQERYHAGLNQREEQRLKAQGRWPIPWRQERQLEQDIREAGKRRMRRKIIGGLLRESR